MIKFEENGEYKTVWSFTDYIETKTNEETSSILETQETNILEKQERAESEDVFLMSLKVVLEEDIAEKAYDILKNQIGFTKFEYKKKIDGLTNYEIKADGYDIVLTASDDVYRIFIPNSSYVFYEGGEVKLTTEELSKRDISWEDESQYYIIAKTIIEDCITGNTRFPSDATAMERNGSLVVVQGTVQGKNAFNAIVEEKWTVEFLVYDLDNWSYEPIYIKLGSESVGEFIKLEDWKE